MALSAVEARMVPQEPGPYAAEGLFESHARSGAVNNAAGW
jgi:hypothetical protein